MVDFNCDMGEGLDNEEKLMPWISSCSISCGAHAGNTATIDKVMALALEQDVKIGAHPSYPDRTNFGRKVLQMSDTALYESLAAQLELFKQRLGLQGITLHHVKPHGALYNQIAVDKHVAEIVTEVVQEIFPTTALYVPYGSVVAELANYKGISVIYEAFADRNYNDDLSLVSRSHKNAVLTQPNAVVDHVKNLIAGQVHTLSGKKIPIRAQTFCVHGDNPNAEDIVKILHQHFANG